MQEQISPVTSLPPLGMDTDRSDYEKLKNIHTRKPDSYEIPQRKI